MEGVEALRMLSKATSKDDALKVLCDAYSYRNSKKIPEEILKSHSQTLGIDIRETAKVLRCLGEYSDGAVYKCWKSSEEAGIPAETKEGQLLSLALVEWHAIATDTKVGAPKLVSFSAQVLPRPLPRFSSDQQQSHSEADSDNRSQKGGRMCLLNLKIQNNAIHVSKSGDISDMTVELPQDILENLVQGLGHIRSQLSSVTKNT